MHHRQNKTFLQFAKFGWKIETNIHLMKKNVSTENVALLIVWNMKFLSVTVRRVLFSAIERERREHVQWRVTITHG